MCASFQPFEPYSAYSKTTEKVMYFVPMFQEIFYFII